MNVAFQHFHYTISKCHTHKKVVDLLFFSGGSTDRFTQHLTDLIHLNSKVPEKEKKESIVSALQKLVPRTKLNITLKRITLQQYIAIFCLFFN